MRVKADIETQAGVWWIVPRRALLSDGQGDYVYQIQHGNKARRVNVKTMVESADRYGVDGALNASQPLVVAGNYELHDGASVHVDNPAPQGKPSDLQRGQAR
jgi:multidrug efflux pump subunit AcrA (membrane-fusion protein)